MSFKIATDFIKDAEGLRLETYRDGAGVLTIGWGHTGPDVREGLVITEERASRLLEADMAWAMDTVRHSVRVTLTEEHRAALVSLTLNIGSGGFRTSTALRRLNAGNFEGAAEAILMWNKITVNGKKVFSKGLMNRRERERALFLSSAPTTAAVEVAHGSVVTGGEAKPAYKSTTQWLGTAGVLSAVMAAWGQIRADAPELLEFVLPYLPYLLGAIFIAVMFNRWLESRKGEH